jgi:type I restriction enzyme R subunit
LIRTNNRFIAVCQLKVRILGTEHHIVPDIVLFLNGLPLGWSVPSPKVKDAIPEAIDQLPLQRAAGQGGGNAALLLHQFVVTCRQESKFATITTHTKYFYRWADPIQNSR